MKKKASILLSKLRNKDSNYNNNNRKESNNVDIRDINQKNVPENEGYKDSHNDNLIGTLNNSINAIMVSELYYAFKILFFIFNMFFKINF